MFPVLNKRGIGIVEILLAAGLIAGVALMTFQLTKVNLGMGTNLRRFFQVDNYKSQLVAALRNNDALQYTATNNNMPCLTTHHGCVSSLASGVSVSLKIYSQNNQLLSDPDNGTFGFDESGAVCNTFGSTSACKYRYVTTVKNICSGTCMNPQFVVIGSLKTSDTSLAPNSATAYGSFEVYIGDLSMTNEAYCLAAGGTFSSGQCQLPYGKDCPTGQRVVGLNPDTNTIQCEPLFSGAPWDCGAGRMLKGFHADGTPTCIAITCPSTSRPPCYDFPYLCTATEAPIYDYSTDGGGGGGGGGGGCGGAGGCGS